MTTANAARESIYSAFIAAWGALDPAVPYTLDNENFNAPNGASWVRFGALQTDSAQATLGAVGNRRYERRGGITLELYLLTDKGAQKGDQLIKLFRDTFEGVTLDGAVYCTDCQVNELGIEGPWWRVNAVCAFWFEEIK